VKAMSLILTLQTNSYAIIKTVRHNKKNRPKKNKKQKDQCFSL